MQVTSLLGNLKRELFLDYFKMRMIMGFSSESVICNVEDKQKDLGKHIFSKRCMQARTKIRVALY